MNNDVLKQYPTEYIQEFLNNHGIIWDGEYVFMDTIPQRPTMLANIELRKKVGNVDGTISIHADDINFKCTITEHVSRNSDKTIFKDFSKEWVEFLISKEPQRAYNIKKQLEFYINMTHEYSAKKIKDLKEQIQEIKKQEKTTCKEWNQLLDIANKSIDQTTAPTDEERSL